MLCCLPGKSSERNIESLPNRSSNDIFQTLVLSSCSLSNDRWLSAIIGQISTSKRTGGLWWWYFCHWFSSSLSWSVSLVMVFSCWNTASFVLLLLVKTDGFESSRHKGIKDCVWGQSDTHVTSQISLYGPWHIRIHILYFLIKTF